MLRARARAETISSKVFSQVNYIPDLYPQISFIPVRVEISTRLRFARVNSSQYIVFFFFARESQNHTEMRNLFNFIELRVYYVYILRTCLREDI